jgi:hypothetical protein
MDDWRIDGVDHEQRFRDSEGNIRSGWHRHIWSANSKDGYSKEHLDDFGKLNSRRDFVRDASDLLGIELKEAGGEDYGTPGLLFS